MSPHAMVTFIAAAKGHVWGRRPTVASVCVDVWVSGYPWRPCGFLRSGVMLVSKGHALPSGAMVTSRFGCCSELSGSAWLGSVMKSEVLVGTKGHTETCCWVVASLVSGSHGPARAILIWAAGATSWSQNFCLGQVATKGYVRVCGCGWSLCWCLGPMSLQETTCDEIREPCWSNIFSWRNFFQ